MNNDGKKKYTKGKDIWLQLLKDSGYITEIEFESIHNDCLEIIRLLVSSINTAKRKS